MNYDFGLWSLIFQHHIKWTYEVFRIKVNPMSHVDARLLRSSKGYLLVLANYHSQIGNEVKISVRLPNKDWKATSAYHGPLDINPWVKAGYHEITIPKLGYGDILRIE